MRQSEISNLQSASCNQQAAISNFSWHLLFIASGIEAVMNGLKGGDPVTIE